MSEDMPGITMPAPPPKSTAPIEYDEPEFDRLAFHAEEDLAEAESGHEGPLRVFLGGGTEDSGFGPASDEPVFDVSALAMPDADLGGFADDDGLSFLDEAAEDDEIVPLGEAPPPLTMQGSSLDEPVDIDPAESWDDGPTVPAARTAIIRDQAPNLPPSGDIDPFDAPERGGFVVGDGALDDFADEVATRVEAVTAEVDPADVWDDDQVTAFFEGDGDVVEKQGLPRTPPQLKIEPPQSRSFKAVPDKADPPVIPVLVLLVGIVIMSLVIGARYAGEGDAGPSVVRQPIPRAPVPAPYQADATAAASTEEVLDQMGYLTVDADKPANIYVGDRKMGITPIVKIEVQPGNHRVLAVEVETGKRKALTAQVVRGEERRVRFEFRVGRL